MTQRRWAVLAALTVLVGATASYAQETRSIFHLSLELADLGIAADTMSGIAVIAQPSVTTKEKREGYIWLRFHPDSSIEWINSAMVAIKTPVPGAQSEGIQWSRALASVNGRGAMSLGRSRKKGSLQKTHWLAIADSTTGWRFELSGAQADSLLRLLWTAGTQSRIDTTPSAPYQASSTDVPVRVLHQPSLKQRGLTGRVVAQYVVGVDGLIEPGSFVAFLASDPALVADALEAVRAVRFSPAERHGKKVRQLVEQQFNWFPGPR